MSEHPEETDQAQGSIEQPATISNPPANQRAVDGAGAAVAQANQPQGTVATVITSPEVGVALAGPVHGSLALPPIPTAAAQIERAPCFSRTELAAEFRQGEIITGLEQVVRVLPNGDAEIKQHPFALVFSQDCDLAADYRARQTAGGKPDMNGILLFEAFATDGFLGGLGYGSKEKRQVLSNQNVRYHVLVSAAPAEDLQGHGFESLAIDFRRYFTLTAEDITGQVQQGARRRARLLQPYVNHMQARAMYYLGRVALPDSD